LASPSSPEPSCLEYAFILPFKNTPQVKALFTTRSELMDSDAVTTLIGAVSALKATRYFTSLYLKLITAR